MSKRELAEARRRKIMEVLGKRSTDGATYRELMGYAGISRSVLDTCIKKLRDDGRIETIRQRRGMEGYTLVFDARYVPSRSDKVDCAVTEDESCGYATQIGLPDHHCVESCLWSTCMEAFAGPERPFSQQQAVPADAQFYVNGQYVNRFGLTRAPSVTPTGSYISNERVPGSRGNRGRR